MKLNLFAVLLLFPAFAFAGNIGGIVYLDNDESAESLLHQGFNFGDRVLPNIDIEMSDGTTAQVQSTGSYGTFSFSDLPDGVY